MSAVQRFASIDALRGLTVAAMLLVNNPGDWSHVYAPLLHAHWHGFTPTDLVFPMFLFIVGVSIALGVVPRVEQGGGRRQLTRTVLLRAARIVGLGLLLHLLAWWWLDLAHFRPWGVLQRIGLCFAVVGALAVWTRARAQWFCIGMLLVGYAWLLHVGGTLEPWRNIVSRVDTALFGPLLYQYDAARGLGHDPEGLLSTLGALATTLIGVRAGDWLRRGLAARLPWLALVALMLAVVWQSWLPFNKNLWTSSYVLLCAGLSTALLWLAHLLVDRLHWPALGRSFGVNAIAAYVGSAVMVYALAALGWWARAWQACTAWLLPMLDARTLSLLFALAFVAVWWGVMRWMDRRGIRITV